MRRRVGDSSLSKPKENTLRWSMGPITIRSDLIRGDPSLFFGIIVKNL